MEAVLTIIAAVHDKGGTWIASDTMSTDGGTKMFGARKWVVKKPWAVGIAGHYRTAVVLQAKADDIFAGLSGPFDFTCRVRGALDEDGYSGDGECGAKSMGQGLILANPEGVWAIDSAFSFEEVPAGEMWADGTGRAYGLGAAFAHPGKPRDRIKASIEAAIRYCNGCGGKVWIEHLKG